MSDRFFHGLCALALASGLACSAQAILIRHDVDDAAYHFDANEYPALATVGDAHGTLIAPQWVLTAAHVVDKWTPGSAGGVRINGRKFGIERVVLHDAWPGSGMPGIGEADWVDLALLKLDTPVTGVEPIQPGRTHDEVGQTVIVIGTGATGDGAIGVTGRDRVLRFAHNIVTEVDDAFILMPFDEPPNALPLEGSAGLGDSGGPAIALTPDGPRVIGVCSRNSEQGATMCQYGTTEYYARVSTHMDWMDAVMAPGSAAGAFRTFDDDGWPTSAISDAAQDFFAALRAGDVEALTAFETKWRGENESAARAANWERMLASGGLVSIEEIAVLNSTNQVVRARFENTLRQFRFGFEMDEPLRLRTIEVGRISAGS